MTGARERGVDPRFDARFQRGGAAADAPPVPPQDRAPRAQPAIPPAPVPEPEAPADADVVRDADADSDDEAADTPPRRGNPFLIALAIVSAVLLAGGLALVARRPDTSSGLTSPDESDQILQQIAWALPGPLLGAGVLGLVLALAIAAIARVRA